MMMMMRKLGSDWLTSWNGHDDVYGSWLLTVRLPTRVQLWTVSSGVDISLNSVVPYRSRSISKTEECRCRYSRQNL